ncbi:hypothetical protein TcBrA4_0018170 [Trypanosoma cruzi]|nr:hypothetical protein TcBrA4_0018170 [Trypanosoma cruzi]
MTPHKSADIKAISYLNLPVKRASNRQANLYHFCHRMEKSSRVGTKASPSLLAGICVSHTTEGSAAGMFAEKQCYCPISGHSFQTRETLFWAPVSRAFHRLSMYLHTHIRKFDGGKENTARGAAALVERGDYATSNTELRLYKDERWESKLSDCASKTLQWPSVLPWLPS